MRVVGEDGEKKCRLALILGGFDVGRSVSSCPYSVCAGQATCECVGSTFITCFSVGCMRAEEVGRDGAPTTSAAVTYTGAYACVRHGLAVHVVVAWLVLLGCLAAEKACLLRYLPPLETRRHMVASNMAPRGGE